MKARGVDVKTDKVVEGYHCEIQGKHYIILNSAKIFVHHYIPTSNPLDSEGIAGFVEIYPDSLALDTGIPDKNGKAIFGSYPVDGVMSKGGDKLKMQQNENYYKGAVVFNKGCFDFLGKWIGCMYPVEIIGSQWEAKQ